MTNKQRRRRNRRKQRQQAEGGMQKAVVRSAGVPPAVVAASSPPHPGCRQDAGDTAGETPAVHTSAIFSDIFSDPIEMMKQRAAAHDVEYEKIDARRDLERAELLKKSEQIEREIEAGFDEGIEGFCKVRRKLNEEFEREQERIQEQFYEEAESVGAISAQRVFDERYVENAEQHLALNAPVWQQISGLYPNSHREMEPLERRRRIGILLARVEKMMRKCATGSGDGCQGASGSMLAPCSGARESDSKEQRKQPRCSLAPIAKPLPPLWSPIPEICVYLEIPKRTLSDLSKEATGLSIEQMYDRIKAESLRGQLREALGVFVAEWISENKFTGRGAPSTADEIYAALKASRRGPRFHRSQWAFELGYSSYQRLFRACQLSEGMTPHQLEIALIEEILEDRARCNGGQNGGGDTPVPVQAQRIAEKTSGHAIKEGPAINSAAENAKAG